VIVALGVLAALVWVIALNRTDLTAGGCQDAAAAALTPGQRLPQTGLDGVPPAPPEQVTVHVLNANGQRGEATVVATGLAALGFDPADEPGNDPLHPAFDLPCYGEIRFGPAGQAAARTLSLAVPCAELVRDGRPDPVVDLALGTRFTALGPNDAARETLQGLVQQGQPILISRGGQNTGSPTPAVNSGLLHQARQADC
jgi:hypothetical protein